MSVLSRLGISSSILDFEVKRFFRGLIGISTIAAAGSDETDATAITTGKVVVTAANGTKGVILPVGELDMAIEVINTESAQDLKVYPNTGAQINALTATTGAFTVVGGASRTFFCDAALHWYVGAGNLTGTATTSTTAELNYLDITTLGTGAASKAVVLDAGEDYTWPATGVLTYGVLKDPAATTVTATGAEMNYLDIAALGTGAASKAVVLDAGEDYTWPAAGILTYGVLKDPAGVTLTAGASELNTLDNSVKSTLMEDFHGTWAIGDAGPADLWSTTAGSGANTELATTVSASLNGEVTLKSSTADGTNAANNTALTGINLGYKAENGGLAVEVRVKIDDITEAYLFVGFTDVISTTVESPITFTDGTNTLIADAANACGIVFTGDSTTQEFAHGGVKATAVTAAAFSGSAPVNNTYVVLRVEVSAAGAVQGFVNGTAIGAAVANAVTTTTALTPAVIVGNTAAAQTIATVDYVKTEQNRVA